jgi:FAD/FMN-containing dehydrogenase
LSAWVVHLGSDADVAEAEAEPLRRLGHPLHDLFERTPFADLQTIYDEAFPMGRRHFSEGQLVPELTDSVIGAILERAHAAPSGSGRWTVELTVFVGAMQCQPDVTCAFLPQREPFWDVLAMGDWSDPAEDEAYASWARSVSEAVRCVTGESAIALPNDVSEFDQARARAAYPGVVERLVGLKARYDPDNVFHRNPNIAGAVSA